jgi:hypothetical protein
MSPFIYFEFFQKLHEQKKHNTTQWKKKHATNY